MEIKLFQIDSFTKECFSGNPAAVCPLDNWLEDKDLQAIAAENNLSETAFLVGSGARYEIRWFTPTTEVDLCGHATLASGYVIAKFLNPAVDKIWFSSKSGELSVTRKEDRLCLDFPSQPGRLIECPDILREAIGMQPIETLISQAHVAVLDSEKAVQTVCPRMDLIKELDSLGLLLTAQGKNCDFVSRCFFPRLGIPEDPVTGSAHCTLAPYWAEKLGKNSLQCKQISNRGGDLWCEVKDTRVEISGHCVLYLRGHIELERNAAT